MKLHNVSGLSLAGCSSLYDSAFVCDSACSTVCGTVWQYVRQHVSLCGSSLCVAVYVTACLAVMCGSGMFVAVMCGSGMCVAVRMTVCVTGQCV